MTRRSVSRITLGTKATSGSTEAFRDFPVTDLTIQYRPRVFGEAVRTLVTGDREVAPMEAKGVVDVTLRWTNLDDWWWTDVAQFVKDFMANPAMLVYFYPSAKVATSVHGASTGPHADYTGQGIQVVPEITEDIVQTVFQQRGRVLPATLVLRGKTLLANASIPTWVWGGDF